MEYITINSYLTESFLEENFIKKKYSIGEDYISKKGNVIIGFYGCEPVDIKIDNVSVEQAGTFDNEANLLHNGDYITGISKDLINKINSIVL